MMCVESTEEASVTAADSPALQSLIQFGIAYYPIPT